MKERARLLYHSANLDIEFYNIMQDKKWNVGGARNLVFKVVRTDFVLLIDCDLIVPSSVAMRVLEIVAFERSERIMN